MAWPSLHLDGAGDDPRMGEVDVADVAMCVGDEFALLQCDNVQVGRRLRELLRAKTREQLIFGMGYCLPPIVNLIRDL
jgi:hypothetical protein